MAEPVSADQALKELTDKLLCSICHNSFTDPKLLHCFHVFCKDCLERRQHGPSLCCQTCRHSTLLPANGVSGLQPAFHIDHLLNIRDTLQKVKQGQEGQMTQCEKCKKNESNGFCRDCGKFLCDVCIEVHQTCEEHSTNKVISLEQLKRDAMKMVPPTKKTLYCERHPGQELDLFCEKDQELICLHCIVKIHRDHKCDLVNEAFPRHQRAIVTDLEPVKQQLNTVDEAIQGLNAAQHQIFIQRAAIEADIQSQIRELQEALEVRKTKLIDNLDRITQQKLKTLSTQRAELKLIQTRLNSCHEFVSDSLNTGSEGEILAMEKPVVQQVKKMCAEVKPKILPPKDGADVVFTPNSGEILRACQRFGQIDISHVCPEKCYAIGKGMEVATVGEQSTATVHAINRVDKKCDKPLPLTNYSCKLVSSRNAEGMRCKMTADVHSRVYDIGYQPTHRGKHQMHIKVQDRHIRGSPFTLVVLRKLEAPTRTITGLSGPRGVAVNKRGQVIVAERDGHCISIYSPEGMKVKSFGEEGSAPGQLKRPCGVAVDGADNILVADVASHHIQKFTSDGNFMASFKNKGIHDNFWNDPLGINISPNGQVYVCDNVKSAVQILKPDLTFLSSFGSDGSGDGQFSGPWDVAFDSQGDVYVADSWNHRIQVFTKGGRFLRKFGKKGQGDGELNWPASVAIDSDDVVYVADHSNCRISLFSSKGLFLKSFRTRVEGPEGEFYGPHGVAVNNEGVVYVSDGCKRLQIF